MTITEIENCSKGKYLLYLNDEAAFTLYGKEVKEFSLKEGMELSQELYQEILEKILTVRAKRRTLHLLDRRDMTERELRDRLEKGYYPEEAIDSAVEAAKKGNYLNDRRYAMQYALERSRRKSRRRIAEDLRQKGISAEEIELALEDISDSDQALLQKLIEKRCRQEDSLSPQSLCPEKRGKLIRFLASKGFTIPDIRRALQEYENCQ
ncbi:MAG: recombination regulator RecX [Lachnospiraceae bacterium]|nr:recombination regulator RecX [Lachnospiraceae bacterium]